MSARVSRRGASYLRMTLICGVCGGIDERLLLRCTAPKVHGFTAGVPLESC